MFSFLYQHLFKPLAFSQDPELVHDRITAMGELLGKFSLIRQVTHKMFAFEDQKLERTIAGITFKNPIGLAAGFDKNARLIDILPYVGFGFAEFGSITAKPSEGNPKPRLWRLPESQALVVNYGLANEGVDVVLGRIRRSNVVQSRKKCHTEPVEGLPSENTNEVVRQAHHDIILENFRIGISVAKTNCKETADESAGIADYFECFQKVNASGLADYITINVSCPNAYGGEPFTTPEKFERLSARLKEVQWRIPVFVKLPCDYTPPYSSPSKGEDTPTIPPLRRGGERRGGFDGMLDVAIKYGYSGVILSNLTKDRINNPIIQKSDLSKVGKGGISGKPTFEKSNNLIKHAREYLNSSLNQVGNADLRSLQKGNIFVIIGCGGVFSGEDAKVKLDAGADLIQMITGMIYQGPQVVGEINKYLTASHL